ncbi:MAG: hypothetical protein ACI96W_002126, partial [Paraglaciecola sp.]
WLLSLNTIANRVALRPSKLMRLSSFAASLQRQWFWV